ncbi:MAG: nucleotide sugar dehydrogenase [Candidatus Promineofilum sp.]|nr:nucleotide sugar dehydrogenase [Promineifilum sp.]
MDRKQQLLDKIANRQALIGIVGLGYVGLPLAVAFAKEGFSVVGVDLDPGKVASLERGESYVEDIPSAELGPFIKEGRIRATTDYAQLAAADAISICVPTPLRKTKDPDISYIVAAADCLATFMPSGQGQLIVLESTTYPGTTDELVLPRFGRDGAEVGRDFFMAFSPERIDPGRTDFTVRTTPKVIGGVTPDCLEVAVALYGTIVDEPVPVSSTATAEMVKLLENTFRAVNIGLVNEVALMCDKLGLNVWEVVGAAASKPYGFMPFYPGPGLGGHCIPIDPHYLSWKLRTLNYTARFIELASEINSHMPDYVVGKVADGLNDERKAINGSHILVLGVAYKRDVGDVRESPALDVIHLLRERGADVAYNDPHIPTVQFDGYRLESKELTAEALAAADCVVVVTDHSAYDWSWIAAHTRLLVDTRNAVKSSGLARIVRL